MEFWRLVIPQEIIGQKKHFCPFIYDDASEAMQRTFMFRSYRNYAKHELGADSLTFLIQFK